MDQKLIRDTPLIQHGYLLAILVIQKQTQSIMNSMRAIT